MGFWHTQLGPYYEGDPRGDGTSRCIGEIVCAVCNNIMGRMLEERDHAGLSVWVPARGSPSDPNSRHVGWAFYAKIEETAPADDEGGVLACWNDHGAFGVDAQDCRQIIERYRKRGKRVRNVARDGPEGVSNS